jgi:hypothetical protein
MEMFLYPRDSTSLIETAVSLLQQSSKERRSEVYSVEHGNYLTVWMEAGC